MTKVAELMGVSLHIERPQENLPGVVVGELGGPMYDLVKQITEVLTQTGDILVSGGYPNLGSFVLEALKEAGRSANQDLASIEVILERVSVSGWLGCFSKITQYVTACESISYLTRHGHCGWSAYVNHRSTSTPQVLLTSLITAVYCFKKALFLIHAIRIRFGSISPPPFPIPSTQDSPIFADNVIPSMLIHLGVLDLSHAPGLNALFPSAESLQSLLGPAPKARVDQQIPIYTTIKEGPSLSNAQAFKLRAAAIDACEMIVSQARSLGVFEPEEKQELPAWLREITLQDLDMWLWSIAKDRPDYRALERYAQRDTVFY